MQSYFSELLVFVFLKVRKQISPKGAMACAEEQGPNKNKLPFSHHADQL